MSAVLHLVAVVWVFRTYHLPAVGNTIKPIIEIHFTQTRSNRHINQPVVTPKVVPSQKQHQHRKQILEPQKDSAPIPVVPKNIAAPSSENLITQDNASKNDSNASLIDTNIEGEYFFTSDEVDVAAFPTSTLELDLQPQFGKSSERAKVAVYIDRTGTVVRTDVLFFETVALAELLQKELKDTHFSPALVGGLPVNNVKIIDFLIGL